MYCLGSYNGVKDVSPLFGVCLVVHILSMSCVVLGLPGGEGLVVGIGWGTGVQGHNVVGDLKERKRRGSRSGPGGSTGESLRIKDRIDGRGHVVTDHGDLSGVVMDR